MNSYAAQIAADGPVYQNRTMSGYTQKIGLVDESGDVIAFATAVNGPTFAQDGGTGAHLNGGGFIATSVTALLGGPGPWAVEFWYQHRSVDNDNTGGRGGGPIATTLDGPWSFSFQEVGSVTVGGALEYTGDLVADRWHHIVMTYDGENLLWTIDGSIYTWGAMAMADLQVGPLCIGGDESSSWGWQGCIAEFAVYDHSLSLERIVQHMGAAVVGSAPDPSTFTGPYPTAVLADRPLAYYRCDEASGTWANDCSGNGHHAAYLNLEGGVAMQEPGLLTSDSDYAVSLDGVTGGLVLPFFGFPGDQYSFEAIFFASSSGDVFSAGSGYGIPTCTINIGGESLGTLAVAFLTTGGGSQELSVSVTPGAKIYVCYTWDGNTGRLYVNGSHVASCSSTGTLEADQTLCVGFSPRGGSSGLQQLKGVVDEIALYDHALIAERVWVHWIAISETPPGPSSGGIAGNDAHYWEVRIYDKLGNLLELPIDVEELSVSRSLNGGAQANATLVLRRPFNAIGPGPAFQNRVQFWFWNGRIARPIDPWWSGYILDVDQSKQKTEGKITLKMTGDMTLLDSAIVTETISPGGAFGNPDLDAMDYIRYLFATYAPPDFGVIVAPPSSFNALPQQFSEQKLGSVIDTVIKQGRTDDGQLYVWTVVVHYDLSRELLIQPDQNPNVLTGLVFKHVFVEGGTSQYDLETKYADIVNVILVLGGQDPLTGQQISAVYIDAESVDTWGPIEDSISVSEICDYDAALAYGEAYLDIHGNPQAQGTVVLTVPDPSIVEGTWVQFWEAPGVIKQMRVTTAEVKLAKGRIAMTLSPTAPTPYLDSAIYIMGQRTQQKAIAQTARLPVNTQTLFARLGGTVAPV